MQVMCENPTNEVTKTTLFAHCSIEFRMQIIFQGWSMLNIFDPKLEFTLHIFEFAAHFLFSQFSIKKQCFSHMFCYMSDIWVFMIEI